MPGIDQLRCRDDGDGAILAVKAVPGSSRDKVVGLLGEELKVATSTAPEKGKANKSLAKTLAKALGVSARDVEIVSGPTSPHKEFRIAGLPAGEVRRRLGEVL